jgi:hypothetical protein
MEEGFEYKVFSVHGKNNSIHNLLERLEAKINDWDGEVIPTGGVTYMNLVDDRDYIMLSQACIVELPLDDTNPLSWIEYSEEEEDA